MESKQCLEVGDNVYVMGEKCKVHDLVISNPSIIKVEVLEGRAAGTISLAILKQVERD
jgi:hypothetical protein